MASERVPVRFNDRIVGEAYENEEAEGMILINVTDQLFTKWITSGIANSVTLTPEAKQF